MLVTGIILFGFGYASWATPASSLPEATVAIPTETVTIDITRTELAAHNTQENCWVSYKGEVRDITTWLPRHPGSAAAIAPYCGKAEEFEAAFSGQHGSGKDSRLEREGVLKGTLVD